MKTATLPAVRVQPELRDDIERVLTDGESLSQFVEAAVRASVRQRTQQSEFLARGMASLEKARRSGRYEDAPVVVASLRKRLADAKARTDGASR